MKHSYFWLVLVYVALPSWLIVKIYLYGIEYLHRGNHSLFIYMFIAAFKSASVHLVSLDDPRESCEHE